MTETFQKRCKDAWKNFDAVQDEKPEAPPKRAWDKKK